MDDGIMYITATNPEPHILMYRSEERLKGWSFETNQSFSPLGKLKELSIIYLVYAYRVAIQLQFCTAEKYAESYAKCTAQNFNYWKCL